MAEKEYIERDSLAGKLIGMKCCSTLSKFDFGDVLRLINSEPAADVQEVRHGKWKSNRTAKRNVQSAAVELFFKSLTVGGSMRITALTAVQKWIVGRTDNGKTLDSND